MRLEIIMVRHGESVNNAINNQSIVGERQTDSQLSELGKVQAIKLGEFMQKYDKNCSISEIHCSPMIRSIDTGLGIKKCLPNSKYFIDQDIFEYGGLRDNENNAEKGNNREWFNDYLKQHIDQFSIDERINEQGWYLEEMIESPSELDQRVTNIIARMMKSTQNVVYVMHGYLMHWIIRRVLAIDNNSHASFQSFNTGITTFVLDNDRLHLKQYNNIEHLNNEADLISGMSYNGVLKWAQKMDQNYH